MSKAAVAGAEALAARAPAPGDETAYPSVDDLVEGSPAPSVEPAFLLPPGTDQEQYEFALAQVRTMQQNAGTQGLDQGSRPGAARPPRSSLPATPTAHWLSTRPTGLVKCITSSRITNAPWSSLPRNYEKRASGRKAPENLLKLAMSLSNLGRASDACQALREMQTKFPDTTENLAYKANAQWLANACE